MNPYSGHMVVKTDGEFAAALRGYHEIPEQLKADAERALAGKNEAHIDLKAKTPLAAWAKRKRKEKLAAKSRRNNRR